MWGEIDFGEGGDDVGGMAIADWMKSPSWLANVSHVLAGFSVLALAALLTHNTWALASVETTLLLYVGVKEFWFDLRYESGEDWASSAIDAAGYVGGNMLAAGVLLLAHAIGGW